ncbi:hypothetical protein A2U01_0092960, partial [Trifolium medium]|nr:hypothetical protein [Trifolium medium]
VAAPYAELFLLGLGFLVPVPRAGLCCAARRFSS